MDRLGLTATKVEERAVPWTQRLTATAMTVVQMVMIAAAMTTGVMMQLHTAHVSTVITTPVDKPYMFDAVTESLASRNSGCIRTEHVVSRLPAPS